MKRPKHNYLCIWGRSSSLLESWTELVKHGFVSLVVEAMQSEPPVAPEQLTCGPGCLYQSVYEEAVVSRAKALRAYRDARREIAELRVQLSKSRGECC